VFLPFFGASDKKVLTGKKEQGGPLVFLDYLTAFF